MPGEHSAVQPQVIHERMAQTAWSALIGGGLLLLFGLYYWNAELTGISDSSIYNAFVDIMVWTLLLGGVLNLASAAVLFLGWRPAFATDAIIAIGTGGMMMLTGLVRMIHHFRIGSMDLQDILLLVFGGMFVRSGVGSWQSHANLAAAGPAVVESERPEDTPVRTEGLKESARDRLLQAKANLRGDAAPQSRSMEETPQRMLAQPTKAPDQARTVAPPVSVDPPAVAPEPGPRELESPADPDAPVEGGFLAELGRSDDNERK